MPENYAKRLAQHLIALEDAEPVFEVDILDYVDADRLIEALQHYGCTVERVPGKTRLIVMHPRLARSMPDAETSADAPSETPETSTKPTSEFRAFLQPRLANC